MRTGLEVFLADPERHLGSKDARVALLCNHTAVDRDLAHAVDRLLSAGVKLVRLFAPEHGVRATAQDMETVGEVRDPVSGLPVISLYGDSAESLRPLPEQLEDIDVVIFDIQDIGARYYTYQATLGFVMEVAAKTGTRVVVLDRPNPIGGLAVEGNTVLPGFNSFVGAYPIAVRHGMTVGELAGFFFSHCGAEADVHVVRCEGWKRDQWFDETGLPWVYPSPNMPTLETATIYPGMCLFEATNLSEGRGTTRPFNLFGAPWVDPNRMAQLCREGAERVGLRGVSFRPAAFIPGFQKHARVPCQGVEVHLTDRRVLHTLLLGMVTIEAAYRENPEKFQWRAEPYEFVADVPAIDLLTGSAAFREVLESGGEIGDLLSAWEPARQAFLEKRLKQLLY